MAYENSPALICRVTGCLIVQNAGKLRLLLSLCRDWMRRVAHAAGSGSSGRSARIHSGKAGPQVAVRSSGNIAPHVYPYVQMEVK